MWRRLRALTISNGRSNANGFPYSILPRARSNLPRGRNHRLGNSLITLRVVFVSSIRNTAIRQPPLTQEKLSMTGAGPTTMNRTLGRLATSAYRPREGGQARRRSFPLRSIHTC
jgi:hypothetical protein